jgi:quinol monooxygenase YgiN
MNKSEHLRCLAAMLVAMLSASNPIVAQDKGQLVRLAVIRVDTALVDKYNNFLREEIEASICLEPGVITLYAVAERENPERITLFETYSDSSHYKAHLATPHFQKYKQGTLEMVRHLELIEVQPLLYLRKPELSKTETHKLFVRLIRMEIYPKEIDNFRKIVESVMLPGIRNEPGVQVMYAVAKKSSPTDISVLEVYANRAAYENHLKTEHFLKYETESRKMIKSLMIVDMKPVLLGSKPQ